MKRHIKDNRPKKDAFDIAWEKKFGSDDECMKFDSLDEFHQWLEEVINFDPSNDQQI